MIDGLFLTVKLPIHSRIDCLILLQELVDFSIPNQLYMQEHNIIPYKLLNAHYVALESNQISEEISRSRSCF